MHKCTTNKYGTHTQTVVKYSNTHKNCFKNNPCFHTKCPMEWMTHVLSPTTLQSCMHFLLTVVSSSHKCADTGKQAPYRKESGESIRKLGVSRTDSHSTEGMLGVCVDPLYPAVDMCTPGWCFPLPSPDYRGESIPWRQTLSLMYIVLNSCKWCLTINTAPYRNA